MISNQRSAQAYYTRQSPLTSHSYPQPPKFYNHQPRVAYAQPKPVVAEEILNRSEVQIERKLFTFTLKENPRGRFLCITEDAGGRRDTVIIPSTGLTEFHKLIEEMVKVSDTTPEKGLPVYEQA